MRREADHPGFINGSELRLEKLCKKFCQCLTHCPSDTSPSFAQMFSQLIYSKSTIEKPLPALPALFFSCQTLGDSLHFLQYADSSIVNERRTLGQRQVLYWNSRILHVMHVGGTQISSTFQKM